MPGPYRADDDKRTQAELSFGGQWFAGNEEPRRLKERAFRVPTLVGQCLFLRRVYFTRHCPTKVGTLNARTVSLQFPEFDRGREW